MVSQTASSSCVPQVGALLILNTKRPEPNFYLGSRDWVLAGSCVLVAPGYILTVEHVLPPPDRRSAAFFPYAGIHELDVSSAKGVDYTPGDGLVVVPLLSEPPLQPVPVRKIPFAQKASGWAFVGGFGQWEGLAAGGDPALQEVVRVTTDRYPGAPPCHKLDIEWYPSVNNGIRALHYNSGGPIMWGDGCGQYWVVGISREAPPERQIASWIGWQRFHCLRSILPAVAPTVATGTVVDVDLGIPPEGEVVQVAVPEESGGATLTLNAPGETPLQIELEHPYGGNGARLLQAAATSPSNAGNFLARSVALSGGGILAVAVAPLLGLPFPSLQIRVQLRVMFRANG